MDNGAICAFETDALYRHLLTAAYDCKNSLDEIYSVVPWGPKVKAGQNLPAGKIKCRESKEKDIRKSSRNDICSNNYYKGNNNTNNNMCPCIIIILIDKNREVGTNNKDRWSLPRILKPFGNTGRGNSGNPVVSVLTPENRFNAPITAIDFKIIGDDRRGSDILLFVATEKEGSGFVSRLVLEGKRRYRARDDSPIRVPNSDKHDQHVTNKPISGLLIESGRANYVAIAGNVVRSAKLDSCQMYSTCDECMDPKGDPLCGWCLYSSTCSTEAECRKRIVHLS